MSFNNILNIIELRKLKAKFDEVDSNKSALFDTSEMKNYKITVSSDLNPDEKYVMDFSVAKYMSGHINLSVVINSLLDTKHLYEESEDTISFIRNYTSLDEDEITDSKIIEIENIIEKTIDELESFFSPTEIEYMLYNNVSLDEVREELGLFEDNALDKKI